MLSALYAITCPFVRHTGGSTKNVEIWIM